MNVFAVLADDTRRRIVELLGQGERSAGDIAEEFAVTQPAVSRHLRVLREAGMVTVDVRGQHRIYRLDPRPLAEVDGWVRRFWTQRLDALGTEVRRGAKGRTP